MAQPHYLDEEGLRDLVSKIQGMADGQTLEYSKETGLKIKDGGITGEKIADGSVPGSKIENGTITVDKLGQDVEEKYGNILLDTEMKVRNPFLSTIDTNTTGVIEVEATTELGAEECYYRPFNDFIESSNNTVRSFARFQNYGEYDEENECACFPSVIQISDYLWASLIKIDVNTGVKTAYIEESSKVPITEGYTGPATMIGKRKDGSIVCGIVFNIDGGSYVKTQVISVSNEGVVTGYYSQMLSETIDSEIYPYNSFQGRIYCGEEYDLIYTPMSKGSKTLDEGAFAISKEHVMTHVGYDNRHSIARYGCTYEPIETSDSIVFVRTADTFSNSSTTGNSFGFFKASKDLSTFETYTHSSKRGVLFQDETNPKLFATIDDATNISNDGGSVSILEYKESSNNFTKKRSPGSFSSIANSMWSLNLLQKVSIGSAGLIPVSINESGDFDFIYASLGVGIGSNSTSSTYGWVYFSSNEYAHGSFGLRSIRPPSSNVVYDSVYRSRLFGRKNFIISALREDTYSSYKIKILKFKNL